MPGVLAQAELGLVASLLTLAKLDRGTGEHPMGSGSHRRSLVETKMHGFKLLGQRVAARTFHRQITELKIRVTIRNKFSQIGTPTTTRVA